MKKTAFFSTLALVLIASMAFAGSGLNYKQPYTYSYNAKATATKTAAYTLTASDDYVKVTASSADITITLPSIATLRASGYGNKSYKILKTDSTAYLISVAPATGNTIGGGSTRKLREQNDYMVISIANGSLDWEVSYETPYVIEDHSAGTVDVGTISYGANVVFEGSTADEFETTLAVTDPTADATVTIPNIAGTVAMMSGVGSYTDLYSLATVSTTLTTADCGKTFATATDTVIFTLPATAAGCKITFVNAGAAGNNLLTINPNNADQIFGTITLAASVVVMAGSAGDAVSNTKGTSIRGDSMTVVGDGADGWYITSSTGIWADIN